MNDIWKMARLDFYVVKTYSKTMIFTMLYPVVIGAMNQSLVSGISFAMVFIGMMTGYVFSISEKNDMERLYSMLPVSKKHMVIGRYLYTCILGITGLLISLMIQSVALQAMSIAVTSTDMIEAILTGVITFSFYPVFLLPGYYKYGYIKGRFFIFIPLAGYLLILFLFSRLNLSVSVFNDPVILGITVLLICSIAVLLSIMASIRILKNKEV